MRFIVEIDDDELPSYRPAKEVEAALEDAGYKSADVREEPLP